MSSRDNGGIEMGVYGLDHPHAAGHYEALDSVAGIERVLVWDPNETAARGRADTLSRGSYYADGWEAMLADESIPAVCILTNNRDAGRLTGQAMEAGKWVYGDKPGAANVADMEEIVAVGERTGTWFCPCYGRRQYADTMALIDALRAGAVGKLWSFQAVWSTSTAGLRGVENWLFDKEAAGGGIIYWLACHWLDTLRLATQSRVVSVSAMADSKYPGVSVEDVACANLRLENGAIGSLRAGYLRAPYLGYDDNDLMMSFEGSQGALAYVPGRKDAVLWLRSKAPGFEYAAEGAAVDTTRAASGRSEGGGGYCPLFLEAFLEAVAAGTEPPATQHDALYVLKVAEAIYESAATGREQNIEW